MVALRKTLVIEHEGIIQLGDHLGDSVQREANPPIQLQGNLYIGDRTGSIAQRQQGNQRLRTTTPRAPMPNRSWSSIAGWPLCVIH